MKILSVVPSYFPAKIYGGTIFSIHETNYQICKNNKNISIEVLTTTANGTKRLENKKNKLIRILDNYKVFYCYDEIINRFSIIFLVKLIKEVKNKDIIHLQDIFSYFAIITVVVSKIYKKKLIISPRGSMSEWSLKSKFYLIKRAIIFFYLNIQRNINWHVTSKLEKQDLKKIGITKKISIIENFAFEPKYTSINSRWWLDKIHKKKIALGFLGRLDKKKGVDFLLNCFLKANTKNLTLTIAGGDKQQIIRLKKKFKINTKKKIFFLGYIDKLKYNYLSSLDYFIMLSENENFGNVYLESLVAGTPIITSKNTPFKDIKKYNSGYCLSMNEKEVINFLNKLDKNKKKKIFVSKKYINIFEKKKIIKKFFNFYKKLMI